MQRWLFEGESMLSIAVSYDAGVRSIDKRVGHARERWPDLPWSERTANRSLSPTKEWVEMRDGRVGEQETAGSIVKARRGWR